MMDLFSYLSKSDKISITGRIGEFLKKYVGETYEHSSGWLANPDVLNNLDRYVLANTFINERTHNGKYPLFRNFVSVDDEVILNDVAMQIDRLILRRYYMVKLTKEGLSKEKARAKSKDAMPSHVPELIFHFNHSVKKTKTETKKEKVQNADLEMDASYPAYDTSLPTSDRTDANYNFLRAFLKNRNEDISNDLFKAVLGAMNGMTVFNKTKEGAIKNAAARYNVTQTAIKKIINSMNIESSRAIQQKLLRNSTHSKEYALAGIVGNRVLRDDLKEKKLI